MAAIELVLYEYMTINIFGGKNWFDIVNSVLPGMNHCVFKDFVLWILAKRMSGEMCTSLGNGFSNSMVGRYLSKLLGWKSYRCCVEGDDGVFSFYGKPPTPEQYAQFGMVIKLQITDDITAGSFCGIVCDPFDLINVTDPIKAILKFGWTSADYRNSKDRKLLSLLRAKSLSLIYQYCSCPILDALGRWGERVTRGVHWKLDAHTSNYNRRVFYEFLRSNATLPKYVESFRTRALVERRYGIPICDQITIENYFHAQKEPGVIDCPLILRYITKDALDYGRKYIFPMVEGLGSIFGRNYQLSTPIW